MVKAPKSAPRPVQGEVHWKQLRPEEEQALFPSETPFLFLCATTGGQQSCKAWQWVGEVFPSSPPAPQLLSPKSWPPPPPSSITLENTSSHRRLILLMR